MIRKSNASSPHDGIDGRPPVQLRTLGGTVPIAPFIEALGFPAILVPTVNFDNNQHEENENLRIGHFFFVDRDSDGDSGRLLTLRHVTA